MRQSSFGGPNNSISVSSLGLGCSQVGSFGNPAPDEQVRAVLRRALDLGVTVFDTADIYGQGDSEREIGLLLKGRRDAGFVMTKLGKRFSPRMRLLAPLKPMLKPLLRRRAARAAAPALATARREAEMREDFSPARFAKALDASLRRLGHDHVDALLLHSPPAAVCREPAVQQALRDLKTSGKTRLIGVSCDDDDALRAAADMPGLDLVQISLRVFDAATAGLVSRLAERGVGLFVREIVRAQPTLDAPAAVALAIARPHVTCAIVGVSQPAHLDQLAAVCTAPR